MIWIWVEKSPMRDGSGIIMNTETNRTFKVVVQDLVTTTHRVAFDGGREVARAARFTTLLKRLNELDMPRPSGWGERKDDE